MMVAWSYGDDGHTTMLSVVHSLPGRADIDSAFPSEELSAPEERRHVAPGTSGRRLGSARLPPQLGLLLHG